MNKIFILFLSLSISGSITALILFALKPLLKKHISKTWQYYIWLIVIIRFLMPIALQPNLVNLLFETTNTNSISQITMPVSSTDIKSDFQNTSFNNEAKSNYNNALNDIKENIWLLWFGISIIIFAIKITNYYGFLRFIKAGRFKVCDENILNIYNDICSDMNIKRKIPLYTNKLAVSPMIVGIFNPFIILPKSDASQQELKYIFKHELTHYKRMDIFYKWLIQITMCLHWYNPIVYFINKEINKNCELSCDEMIIKNLNNDEKKEYGDTLISTLKENGSYANIVVSITLNENINLLKERLAAIMEFNKSSKLKICVSLVLTCILSLNALLSGCAVFASNTTNSVAYNDYSFSSSNKVNTYYNSFFENSYIISMSWNVNPDDYQTKTSLSIGNKNYTISFSNHTKSYAQNNDVLDAISKIISQEILKNKKFSPILTSPLINKIEGPYTESPDKLAENFYNDKNIAFFNAVIKKANQITKEDLAEKAFADKEVAFFSILSDFIPENEKRSYAKKAYNDKEVAFFSILSDSLTDKEKSELVKKAYNDREVAFFSILSDYLSDSEKSELVKKAYNDGEVAFFNILSDYLPDSEKSELAKKAYNDREVAFFSILSDYLSDSEKSELAKKAYDDDEVAFFSILSDYLSDSEKSELAEKAYKDRKISFFSILSSNLKTFNYDNKNNASTNFSSSLSKNMLAKQAYEDKEIAFFNMFSNGLSDNEKASLAKKAYDDGEIVFFNSLSSYLSDSEKTSLAKKAYEDGETVFFNSLSSYLSDNEKASLAKKAYEDGETVFFNSLSSYLSDSEKATLAKKAYNDEDIVFFNVLSSYLSKNDKATLAKKAYDDENIVFFNVLSSYLSDSEKATLAKKAYDDKNIVFFNALSY